MAGLGKNEMMPKTGTPWSVRLTKELDATLGAPKLSEARVHVFRLA